MYPGIVHDELVGRRKVNSHHHCRVENPTQNWTAHGLKEFVPRVEIGWRAKYQKWTRNHHEGDMLDHVAPEERGRMGTNWGTDREGDGGKTGQKEAALSLG